MKRGRRGRPPKPYKSWLEYDLHNGAMKDYEYEPKWSKVEYTITKEYSPDFVDKRNPNIVYEAKGYFRTYEEAVKYLHVREANPGLIIRFIVSSPNKRAYPQIKMKMGDWLTMHGFEWCTDKEIPRAWQNPLKQKG